MAYFVFLIAFLSFQGHLAFHVDDHPFHPFPKNQEGYMYQRDFAKKLEKEFEKRNFILNQVVKIINIELRNKNPFLGPSSYDRFY